MSYTYANRKQTDNAAPKQDTAPAQLSIDALRTGAAKPTAEQMGRRVDPPDAMRAKMEEAFGADLSAVKLYESEAVGNAGAEAITQGSSIAFAPGMLDFTSFGGQALLGHEISHVVSQSRGEVSQSGGFLNDRALEARADREGAMAAAGQTVAMPAAALSTVSAAPAAGPMQAKKRDGEADKARAQQILGPLDRIEDGRNAEVDDYFTRKFGSARNHGALSDLHTFRYFSRQSFGKSDAEKDEMYTMFTDPSRRSDFLNYVRGTVDDATSLDMKQYVRKDRDSLMDNAVSDAAKSKDFMALSDIIKDNRADLALDADKAENFSNRAGYLNAVYGDHRDRLREITGALKRGEAAKVNGKIRFGGSGKNKGFAPFLKYYLRSKHAEEQSRANYDARHA